MLNSHFPTYARTPPSQRPEASSQTLREHLLNVAHGAEQLARQACPNDPSFAEEAKLAGLLHDLGKYRPEFQHYLQEDGPKTVHSVYGAAHAFSAKAYPLALTVLGHHAGLHSVKDLTQKTKPYVEEARCLVEKLAVRQDGLQDLEKAISPFRQSGMENLSVDLRIRMLFSCLIDADRLDCFRYEYGSVPNPVPLDAEAKLELLLRHVDRLADRTLVETVKQARRDVLNACLIAAAWPERRLSLTVPTGGGKTLASMAFAMRRAVLAAKEVRRIIVVIPFLSIIEQNANVYAEVFGRDAILEHHSGDFQRLDQTEQARFAPQAESEDASSDPARRETRLATENWHAPIIVTTSVRFFESLFSNHPSDLRRLHNIARSVVILDEVQTLPPGFLKPLLSMVRGLADDWCTTFVFCTATQPAFEKQINAPLTDPRWEKGTIRPIISESLQSRLFANLKRVKEPEWPTCEDRCSWEQIAVRIAREERALCVVNTRRHAHELYEKLKSNSHRPGLGSPRIYHLSNRMCAQHRLDKLNEIRETLADEDRACWVVSTQLVEAGVDLDFPVVFRAMGPLDSIVQAAGRCDREGKLTAAAGRPAGRLIVFQPEDDSSPYREATEITRCLAASGEVSLHNPKHVLRYFHELYQRDLDPKEIEGLRYKLDFPEVSNRFVMIDDRTKAVLVPYNREAEQMIRRIEKTGGLGRELWRRSQRYQVGLYPDEFMDAQRKGAIYEVVKGSDIWACQSFCYSEEVGLQVVQPPPDSLIQ